MQAFTIHTPITHNALYFFYFKVLLINVYKTNTKHSDYIFTVLKLFFN